jgi:hypothetical protein
MVPSNPFSGAGIPTVPPPLPPASPATEAASLRVVQVGRKILAANSQLAITPVFAMVGAAPTGAPAEEVFHVGVNQVVVTEPLVRQCQTDGQLAAVLCVELAKMAAEREQMKSSSPPDDQGPPPDVPVGNEARGTFGPADGTRAVELAKYDRSHHRGFHVTADPKIQARTLLTRAGFPAADLDAAAPLLRTAEKNSALEKAMTR